MQLCEVVATEKGVISRCIFHIPAGFDFLEPPEAWPSYRDAHDKPR